MISLTPEQREVLRFIGGFAETHLRAPTMTEIAAGMGYANPSTVHRLICCLEERGAISRSGNRGKRRIDMFRALPVPRAPDGAPLHFVPIERVRPKGRTA